MNAAFYFHCINRTMFLCPSTKSLTKLINKANKLAIPITLPRSSSSSSSSSSIAMETSNDPDQLEAIFEKKRFLRSKIRKELKNMDPVKRSQEDDAIQSIVLQAPWFKNSKSICGYISCPDLREVETSRILHEVTSEPEIEGNTQIGKKLYIPLIVDRNSNMKMLRIFNLDNLIANSMKILEPAVLDSEGNQREDVMDATDPVDLIIMPGLAFDRAGRRLGRSGGYYDFFLKKYGELVEERKWKQPLLVALSYSVQIVNEGEIPVTSNDVPVDALVYPDGVIFTSP